MPLALNTKQSDLLRYLCRQSGPVPVDHLDGRVVRALESREFITIKGGWITPTEAGRTYTPPSKTRKRRDRTETARGARAQMILKAVVELERVMPIDAELSIGGVPAYADDVLDGLRQYARGMSTTGA
jgi:hypothetical protein